MTILIMAGIAALANILWEVIPSGILYKKMKNLPDRIFLDKYTLILGNQALSAGNVLNVLMVPADYEILTRDMVVITKDNTKYQYNLGKKSPDNKGNILTTKISAGHWNSGVS